MRSQAGQTACGRSSQDGGPLLTITTHFLRLESFGTWFILAMALACMWLPFAFAAFALGRRRVTVRFWLMLMFVEGAAMAFFKLVVLNLALEIASTPVPPFPTNLPVAPHVADPAATPTAEEDSL